MKIKTRSNFKLKVLAYLTVCAVSFGVSFFSIDIGFMKFNLYRLCVLLEGFFCIPIMLSNYSKQGNVFGTYRRKYPIYFMILWLFYALLSSLWVPDLHNWLRNYFFLLCGVITIIYLSNTLQDTKDVYLCVCLIATAMFMHSGIGWYEITTGNYLFLPPEKIDMMEIIRRPCSSVGGENEFAMCMLIGIFSMYVLYANAKNRFFKIVFCVALIEELGLTLLSFSRANILGLFFAYSIFLLMNHKKIIKALFCALLFMVVSILLYNFFLHSLLHEINVQYLVDQLSINTTSNTGSDYIRKNLIYNGFLFLFSTLGMGTGVGGIEYYMTNSWQYDTLGIINIHNWWMEILVGSGIFVFVGYLVLYYKLLEDNYKRMRATSLSILEKNMAITFLEFMIAFIIASISSSSNMGNDILWVFFALLIAFYSNRSRLIFMHQ